jgi:hypothetical protein
MRTYTPQLQADLSSWRRSHGGRCKPISPAFWKTPLKASASGGWPRLPPSGEI